MLNSVMHVGFGFSSVTFRLSRVSIPAFSVTPVLTRTNRVLEVARIYTKHYIEKTAYSLSNVV